MAFKKVISADDAVALIRNGGHLKVCTTDNAKGGRSKKHLTFTEPYVKFAGRRARARFSALHEVSRPELRLSAGQLNRCSGFVRVSVFQRTNLEVPPCSKAFHRSCE
jgi:hypothetical protein